MKTNHVDLCHSRNNALVGRGTSTVLRACGQILGSKQYLGRSFSALFLNRQILFSLMLFFLCRALALCPSLVFLYFHKSLVFFYLELCLTKLFFFSSSSLPVDSTTICSFTPLFCCKLKRLLGFREFWPHKSGTNSR